MKKLFIVLITFVISGCGTIIKYPEPSGGSKADGIVKLTYDYNGWNPIQVDHVSANSKARKRCQAWGYNDAISFGYKSDVCTLYNQYGCESYQSTITYQCTK